MTSQPGLPDSELFSQYIDQPTFDALPLQEWPAQWHPTEHFPTPQSVGQEVFRQEASRVLSFTHEPSQYRIGESHLPVAPYRELIIDTVQDNQMSVISAETGSGKSSQIGLYLLEAGMPRVFVTQPRILAARELMQRARQNLGPDHEHLAGYLTGTQADSDCPPDARLIYVTEHLLLKMINRGSIGDGDVLIFDEMHEESPPGVVALSLAKEKLAANPNMRIVASSATIDTGRFSRYLTAPGADTPAPVLELPGRTHPVERLTSGEDVGTIMRQYMRQGKNVIGFEPGLTRMKRTKNIAESRMRHEKVHLLYADQSPLEQRESLTSENGNHIVTNKTGETSITPPNKQVVVDSGLSNLGSFAAGKKVLSTEYSSKAAIEQKAGRVGRIEPGIAVLATPADVPPAPLYKDRPDRDPSPIQNTDVTSFMAELLAAGKRIEDLDLLDMPSDENIRYGYTVLKRLGATGIEGAGLVLTDIGRAMNDLPLDTPLARMVIEARQLADAEGAGGDGLRLQVAAAAAILTAKSMLNATQGSHRRYAHPKPHQETLSREQHSDVLFELDVFTWLYDKQRTIMGSGAVDAEEKFEKLLQSYDILPNRYYKAVRTFEELCLREDLDPESLQKATQTQRQYIVGSQIAGAAEVFVKRGKYSHYDIRGERRQLGRRSTMDPRIGSVVAGTAFDLEMLTSRGRTIKRFIVDGSAVTLEQLRRYAPHRLTEQDLGYMINKRGTMVKRKAYYFDNELSIGEFDEPLPPTLETREALVKAMMTGTANGTNGPVVFAPGTPRAAAAIKVWRAAQVMEQNSPVQLRTAERHASLVRRVVRESLAYLPLDVTNIEELDAVIPQVYRNALVRPTRQKDIPRILQESPDGITIHVGEDEKRYIEVKYKRTKKDGATVAHVWIPRDLRFAISRSDFAALEQFHPVKLQIGAGKIVQIDSAFETIEQERQSMETNRARREERRQRIAAIALDVMSSPAVERTRPPKTDEKTRRLEAQRVKDIARMALVKPPKNLRKRKKYDARAAELAAQT